MTDTKQELYNVICVLTKRLGGEVEITLEELERPGTGTVTRNYSSNTIRIEVK